MHQRDQQMSELGANTAPSARQGYAVFSAATERGSAAGAAFEQDGISSGHQTDAPGNLELVCTSTSTTRLCVHMSSISVMLPVQSLMIDAEAVCVSGYVIPTCSTVQKSSWPTDLSDVGHC